MTPPQTFSERFAEAWSAPTPQGLGALLAGLDGLVHHSADTLVTVGLIAAGMAVFSQVSTDSPLWFLYLSIIPLAMGMVSTMTPLTTLIMSSVSVGRAGVGSAMNDTTRELGGALGVAVLGSLVTSAYTSSLAPAIGGLPAEAASVADSGLSGALAVADRMGGPAGEALAQVLALQQLHHDEAPAVRQATKLEHIDDARVAGPAGRARLVDEPVDHLRIAGVARLEDLHGGGRADDRVAGAIDRAEHTDPDAAFDDVGAGVRARLQGGLFHPVERRAVVPEGVRRSVHGGKIADSSGGVTPFVRMW